MTIDHSGGTFGGTLAVLTVGQSPRVDVTPEIRDLIPGVHILEGGALDELTRGEISRLTPVLGDEVLVSRLRDGSSAVFGRSHVVERMQALIDRLEPEADAILIACSGGFPELTHHVPMLLPDLLLADTLRSVLAPGSTLAVLCPLDRQIEEVRAKYTRLLGTGIGLVIAASSPYVASSEDEDRAIEAFSGSGASALVLDCIGYGRAHRARFGAALRVPVLSARSLSARIAAELVGAHTDGTPS